jgi:hypothetical protein
MTARVQHNDRGPSPTTVARKAAAAMVDRYLAHGVMIRTYINPRGEVVVEPLTDRREDGLDGVAW